MGPQIVQVDAFADRPFAGNPAAVCLLDEPADEGWMQDVANEMNLSETAFLHPEGEGDGYRLRWFTPTVEVDLCGHATLASAHALWEGGQLAQHAEARFHTRSGTLTAARAGDWIEMDFPSHPVEPSTPPLGLAEALGTPHLFVGRTPFDLFVEIASEGAVRSLSPDLNALGAIRARGVIVTGRSEGGAYDFVSRFFAPQSGIAEDPVTGSAHCALGPFWAGRLGKRELVGYQASVRGGTVRVRLGEGRVILGGLAVTTLRGRLVHGPKSRA